MKIFCIIGKSASGKDSILKEILSDKRIKLTHLLEYTTRAKRPSEIEGVNYRFISKKDVDSLTSITKLYYNDNYYIIPYDEILKNKEDDYILITSIRGVLDLKTFFEKEIDTQIIPIYIDVPEDDLIERAIKREKLKGEEGNYSEVCRRFLADKKDFDWGLKALGSYVSFLNDDVEKCVNKVKWHLIRMIL